MVHQIFKLLAPKNLWDSILKIGLFLIAIGGVNSVFASVFYPKLDLPFHYVFLSGVFVGLPFVSLCFFMLHTQLGLLTEMAIQARYDSLTSLANRQWFLKKTRAALERGNSGVLLIMDADHFKLINDTFGHHIGDACLKQIGFWLKGNLRTDDIVGRIGGEEFGVFLVNTDVTRLQKVCDPFLKPLEFAGDDGQILTVTMSIGATPALIGDDLDHLMRRADIALYKAKKNGRARLEVQFEDVDFPVTQSGSIRAENDQATPESAA